MESSVKYLSCCSLGDTAFILLFDDEGSCHLGAKLEFLPKTKKIKTDIEIILMYMDSIK